VERQVLLKVASDFAEQLHPENEEQVGAVLEAMNDPRQGLTLVHFSAQPEPYLTRNTPLTPPDTS
jgi:hypothetical protein